MELEQNFIKITSEREEEQFVKTRNSLILLDSVLGLSVVGTLMGVALLNGLEQVASGVHFYINRTEIHPDYPTLEMITQMYREIIFPASLAYGGVLSLLYKARSHTG